MDYYSLAAYLVVVLDASQAATCLPIDHATTDWDKLAPQINMSLVDFCFFNQSGWKIRKSSSDTSFLCSLVTSNKTLPKDAPHKLLDPARAIYADYVKNLKNDQQTVFECFILLPNLTDSSKSDCWKVTKPSLANDNDTSRAMTLRESNAQMYQDYFAAFVPRMNSTFVDFCYYKKSLLKVLNKRSNVYRFCNLISIRQKAFPDPLLTSMQDMYADYDVNEPNDSQTVLDCYLKHHLTMEDDDCWKVVNRTDYEQNPILKREVYSRAYLDAFDKLYEKMSVKTADFCWYNETLWKTLHPKASWAYLHFCPLITSKVNHTDEKISALQHVYADYASSSVNDEKTILKCFLANLNNDEARSRCWKVLAHLDRFDSITSKDLTKREAKAKAYFDSLEDHLSEMDIIYVEHCYYDYMRTPWYERKSKIDKIFCDLIVNKTLVLSHPLLVQLRELYVDYTKNEKTDYERVWECFVEEWPHCKRIEHPVELAKARCQECWKLHLINSTYKLTSVDHTRRYANAKSYNDKLLQAMHIHTYFRGNFNRDINHCALYHRANMPWWYRCPNVNLKTAPSNDAATIDSYVAVLDFNPNVTKQFDMDQIDKAFVSLLNTSKLRLYSNHVEPLKPLLYSCVVNGGASSMCQNVMYPKSDVKYSAEDKILQKVWKHAQELTLEDDCRQYHSDPEAVHDLLEKCDPIVGFSHLQ